MQEYFNQALRNLGRPELFYLLAILIVLDIVLGVTKAVKFGKVDSKIAKEGGAMHVTVIVLVVALELIARMTGFDALVLFFTIYFCATYFSSILENCYALGVIKKGGKFTDLFNQMQDGYLDKLNDSRGKALPSEKDDEEKDE